MAYFIFFLLGVIITFPPCSSLHNTTEKLLPLSTCLDSERRVLLSVRPDLNTSDFLSSWKGLNCCNWRGVICDNKTGHVIELHLGYPYISSGGFVYYSRNSSNFPSLAGLNHLRYLDFSGYDFSESSTSELIGSLDQLLYLNLSYTIFKEGWPLHQLANLSNLQVLDLYGITEVRKQIWTRYGFDGMMNFSWLQHLISLKYLDLGMLDLSNSEDLFNYLSMLPSLSELRLSDTSLPNQKDAPHVNLTSLVILDLSMNLMNSCIPHWIFNNSNLMHLNLTRNKFRGTLPAAIGNLKKLQYLDLSYNELVGRLPESIGNFCHLEYLDLSYNMFTGNITKLIDGLNAQHMESKLSTLRVGTNRLSGTIPESLGQISKLKVLDLSNNMLEGTPPEVLGSLLKLEELNLSNNSLTGAISEVHLPTGLKELDVSYNRLKVTLPNNYILPFKAHRIRMCNCQLGPRFPSWLRNQTNLDHLCISGANILSFLVGFGTLANFQQMR